MSVDISVFPRFLYDCIVLIEVRIETWAIVPEAASLGRRIVLDVDRTK